MANTIANLDQRHHDFIEWLLNPERSPKTEVEYAAQLDVDTSTLRRWKLSPVFKQAWAKRADEVNISVDRIQPIVDVLHAKALGGDVKAIELYLKFVQAAQPKMPAGDTPKEIGDLSLEELEGMLAAEAASELARRQS